MDSLTRSEIEALVTAIRSGLPSMYDTVQPDDRQEAFAAEANSILDLVAPEDQLEVFLQLESMVTLTDGFTLPLPAND